MCIYIEHLKTHVDFYNWNILFIYLGGVLTLYVHINIYKYKYKYKKSTCVYI